MLPHWLEEIRRDNTSGAVALAAKAARELAEWAACSRSFDELIRVGRELVRAQPRMAPLVNLVAAVLEAGPRASEAARAFQRRLEEATQAVARHAASLIADGDVVLTHSFSSTVLASLREAQQSGRCFSVIATESRPMREGVFLARELAAMSVPVRLIVDAAAALALAEARLVLVGADAVCVEGLVNKIGTRILALAAAQQGVPMYALATGDKFLPAGYRLPPEEPHAASEVLEEEAPGVSIVNYYFELTPLELFTGIVSEDGVLPPAEVRERLACKALDPALLGE